MVVPFGFSIGDFIDVAKLFKDITIALKDHGGAASDYQSTVKKLETIKAVLLSLKDFTPNGASPGQTNAIRTLAGTLGNNVELFLKSVKRYDEDLGCRARKGSRHGIFSKIKWAQFVSKEVGKLDECIAFHSSVLQMLLGMQTSDAVSAIAFGQQRIKDLITTEVASNTQSLTSIQSQLRSNHHIQDDLLSIVGPMAVQLQNLNERLNFQAGPSSTLAPLPRYVPATPSPIALRIDDRSHTYLGTQSATPRSSQSLAMALRRSLALANSLPINDILNTLTTEVEAVTRFALASVLIALRELLVVLPQVLIITRMMRVLPQAMSLTRQNCIRFEDALGRIQVLEYQHFRNWPIFESLVKCHFSGVPGNDRVLRRQYTLMSPRLPNERLVAANWDRKVFPGMTVVMAIHVKVYNNHCDSCPRCSSNANSSWTATGSRCCSCGLVFSRDSTMKTKFVAGGAKSRSSSEYVEEIHRDRRPRVVMITPSEYVEEIHPDRRPRVIMVTPTANEYAASPNDDFTESEDETENLKVFKRVKLLQTSGQAPSTSREIVVDMWGNRDRSLVVSSFRTRRDGKKFFRVGRVFAMLWDADCTAQRKQYFRPSFDQEELPNGTRDRKVLRRVRRMVVVEERDRWCLCIPIETYNHQGVAGKGLSPLHREEHAIIYLDDTNPILSSEEEGIMHKAPIAITAAYPGQKLHPMSRVNFGCPHNVDWHVKVKPIGKVHKDHMATFKSYWH